MRDASFLLKVFRKNINDKVERLIKQGRLSAPLEFDSEEKIVKKKKICYSKMVKVIKLIL